MMIRNIITSLLCWICCMATVYAQFSVTSVLDSTTILLGDQVRLHFNITQPEGARYQVPDFKAQFDTLDNVEIIAIEPVANPNAKELTQSLLITSFEEGTHQIPSVSFSTKVEHKNYNAISNPVYLEVKAIAVADTTSQIRPIKDILEEPRQISDWIHWVWIGLGIVLGILVVYFLIKRFRNRQGTAQELEEKPKEIIPAHIVAFRKLEALEQQGLWQKGEIKAYYSALSHIGREYVENRYEFNALESVTDEIAKELNKQQVETELKDGLLETLRLADFVKFAKGEPSEAQHQQSFFTLHQFVDRTQFVPPVIEETEEEA